MAVTAIHKVATSVREIQGARVAMQPQPSKCILGPYFVSTPIFKTGLLLLLKNDLDQQSDKGKKQAANYLNLPPPPPPALEFQHGEQTTVCELMWI